MKKIKVNATSPQTRPQETISYINNDGDIVCNSPIEPVMVRNSADLDLLAGMVLPGTVAFTAGGGSRWQLAADGTWATWGE